VRMQWGNILGPAANPRHREIGRAWPERGETGAVLLEVVLALVLFVGAAAVISSAFNASLLSLERLRLNTRASNFAATILAELQIGIRPLESAGPETFAIPYEGWSWEVVAGPADEQFASASQLKRVEVIVRHAGSGLVHRLAQLVNPPEVADDPELTDSSLSSLPPLSQNADSWR